MLRLTMNKRLVQIAVLPFFGSINSNDNVPKEKLKEITPIRIGIDKVKDFFYDEYGNTTPKFQAVLNATTIGILSGFVIGGLVKAKATAENFMMENQGSAFRSEHEAKRLLHFKMATALFKGGVRFGIKVGTFCFLFASTSEALQTYQGKFNALNHVAAGAVAGSIYKMNMGLKGAFAGCVLGSMLGCISGTAAALILYITGTEMGDLFEASNKWMEKRRQLLIEATRNEEVQKLKEMSNQSQTIKSLVYDNDLKK